LLLVDEDNEKSGIHYRQYKMASDGKVAYLVVRIRSHVQVVLVPQPSDDANDPLNWASWKKHMLLVLVAFGGWNADFASGVGIPSLLLQGAEWGITPTHVNDSGNLGILMLGVGGIFWIPVIHYWGRAPVFFYTQIIGTFMTLGCALAPNFAGFYGFRALQTFFLTSGQCMGLAVIKDMFFFHELARKINLYILIFYASPYLGPQLAGWIIYGVNEWRPVFWISFAWGAMVVILTILFFDETHYTRENPYPRPPYSQKRRLLELVGYYGVIEPRRPVSASYGRLLAVIIKPVVIPVMLFFSATFMWAIVVHCFLFLTVGDQRDHFYPHRITS
jgi:MFS family permease